ncbi:MAG: hypothetical protein ACTHLE_04410 [Agriterribacter sp.]
MSKSAKDRLEKVFYTFETNANKLAKDIGKDRSQGIYDVLNGKVGISKKLAKQITELYPDVREAWLLTGDGKMKNTEVEDGDGLKASEVSSDPTGLILTKYLSSLAVRCRGLADEIDAILQAMSGGSSGVLGTAKQDLKTVRQIIDDIRGKKDSASKLAEKEKQKP